MTCHYVILLILQHGFFHVKPISRRFSDFPFKFPNTNFHRVIFATIYLRPILVFTPNTDSRYPVKPFLIRVFPDSSFPSSFLYESSFESAALFTTAHRSNNRSSEHAALAGLVEGRQTISRPTVF